MLASYKWLKELSGVNATSEEYAEKLTSLGLEVESTKNVGRGFENIVVAEVKSKSPHPKKDNWTLVEVSDGNQTSQVICGASNVPNPGGKVIFARVGATLPNGIQIAERKMAGVVSRGMLCSELELEIGNHHEGIFVFDETVDAKKTNLGVSIDDALDLEDTIFEIGLTPNRPDCLGHIGLAREICLGFGQSFTFPSATFDRHEQLQPKSVLISEGTQTQELKNYSEAEKSTFGNFQIEKKVSIEIQNAQKCPRYGAAMLRGIKVSASPFSVRYRLFNLGVRALSNIVDVTNLVMLEWGHPIHAFDASKISENRILVRTAKPNEKIKTLDGEIRECDVEDLLICDASNPIAIGGVMGGEDSEIDENSTDVLIECAYFNPKTVRKTSKKLSMHTEASHRFERGVDPNDVPFVLARAAVLSQQMCGGEISPTWIDNYPEPVSHARVKVELNELQRVLGLTDLTEKTVENTFEGIGAQVIRHSEKDSEPAKSTSWDVLVPSWRPDITRPVDLAEEVARVVGFDQIPVRIPHVRLSQSDPNPQYQLSQRIKEVFTHLGFCEAIGYSFVSPKDLERARVSTRAVALSNPLSEEKSLMRTSLLPGLLQAAGHALSHQVRSLKLFEVGTVFELTAKAELPRESQMLAFIIAGPQKHWIDEGCPADFFDGKGVIESSLQTLSNHRPQLIALTAIEESSFLHPQKRASVILGNETIGVLGEIHPEVSDNFEIDSSMIYAEIDVQKLVQSFQNLPITKAQELPKFPSVNRDIAALVDEKYLASELEEKIFDLGSGLVERVELFDLYEGAQIPKGQRSLAFHVTYRDQKKTLTDKRVDEIHQKVTEGLSESFALTFR